MDNKCEECTYNQQHEFTLYCLICSLMYMHVL